MAEPRGKGYIESGQRLVQPAGREWSQGVLLAARNPPRTTAKRNSYRLCATTKNPQPVPMHGVPTGPQYRPALALERVLLCESPGRWASPCSSALPVPLPPSFTSSEGHPKRAIWFDVRIWRIAEVILHSATLYRELNIPPTEPYVLAVNHQGLEAREFYYSKPRWPVSRGRICQSPAATWTTEVTQDYVISNLKSLVREVANGLFVLFDFAQVDQKVVDGIVDKFLSSRL